MCERRERRGGETPAQWARVLWLDREIRAGRFPNAAGLQVEFDISRRAAFNVVQLLRDSLGAPVEFCRKRGGYFYSDPTYALPSVFLEEGELLALALAPEVARQYLGTPLEAPLREAVRKISRYLPESVQLRLGDLAEAFHIAGGSSVEVPAPLLADVQRAVRESRVMRILYYTAARDETREREIEPHFLLNVRGDWILAAWDYWREAPRDFMCARILEHEVLERRFERRPALRPEVHGEHAFLTEHGGEPYEVVLRFDAYQARWIRERRWHPSQQAEELDGGGLLLRLRVSGVGDVTRWVLGYGSHVEVVAPEWLRELVAQELVKAAGLYALVGLWMRW